jgi:hypothetical protein
VKQRLAAAMSLFVPSDRLVRLSARTFDYSDSQPWAWFRI